MSAFLGVVGGIYAGAVSSFVALKNRGFGMRVQGMAVGYIVSNMLQAFVVGFILEKVSRCTPLCEFPP